MVREQRSLRKAIPKLKHLKPTTRGIPRRSPIQVLTSLYRVWLRWSDENRYFSCDVVVDKKANAKSSYMSRPSGS